MRDAIHFTPPDAADAPAVEPATGDGTSDVLDLVSLQGPAPRPSAAVAAGSALSRGVVTAHRPPGEGARSPACYEVRLDGAPCVAQQAESCVLVPEPGDLVLVNVVTGETPSYILAVLERRSRAPRVWRAPAADPIELSAEQLDLTGAQGLGIRAPDLDITAQKATLALRTASLTSDVVRGVADTLVWVSQRLQTVADRSMHQAGSYIRSVASVDTVVAEHMARSAHQTITTTTTNDVLTATEDVHISGKRIHMR